MISQLRSHKPCECGQKKRLLECTRPQTYYTVSLKEWVAVFGPFLCSGMGWKMGQACLNSGIVLGKGQGGNWASLSETPSQLCKGCPITVL